MPLTIFTRVTCNGFRLRTPAQAVPALNFDLVRDESGCVPDNKRVRSHELLLPHVFHPQFAVAQLVFKAWSVALSRQQWLENDLEIVILIFIKGVKCTTLEIEILLIKNKKKYSTSQLMCIW